MKQRLNIGMLFLTLLAGGAGMAAWYFLFIENNLCSEQRFLAMGAYFSISLGMGLLGLFLAELLQRKRFRVIEAGNRIVSLLLAAALGMGLGAGGQALYSLTWQADTKLDIVLLLDRSGSMEDDWDSCSEVACEFIDLAEETSRIQVISFADTVSKGTGLLLMDEAGKETAKAYIRQIQTDGGTDFDRALKRAAEDLKNAADREDRKQAVVMATDGKPQEGSKIRLGSEIQETYQQEELAFYPIQFYDAGDLPASMDELTVFAEATGGFDTRLERDMDGQIGIQEMKKAFDEAYTGALGLALGDIWLGFGAITENTVWRFAVRIVVFAIFAVLSGFVYYRRQTRLQTLGNAAAGCLAAILISLAGNLSEKNAIPAAMLLTDVFIVGAWASCEISGKTAGSTDRREKNG